MRAIQLSKLFGNACLLQNGVGSVAGFYGVIDRKAPAGDGAVPDFVIAPSGPLEGASVGAENLLELRRESRHQDAWTATPDSSCA